MIDYYLATLVLDRPLGEIYMIPRTQRHLANRAFAVAAPSFWNSLPDNVRDSESYSNFLSKLQTHYFNIAFYNHIIC